MNYERISQLHNLLNAEFKKPEVDFKRVAEINYYLSQEFGVPPEPTLIPEPSLPWWQRFSLPPNWKIYVTAVIGAAVAVNSQLHLVAQNVQDALLAGAVVLGFWSVNSTQILHFENLKTNITSFGVRMGITSLPPEEQKKRG